MIKNLIKLKKYYTAKSRDDPNDGVFRDTLELISDFEVKFKDFSKVPKIPFNVGDELFDITKGCVRKMQVSSIDVSMQIENAYVQVYAFIPGTRTMLHFELSEYGKIIFKTKEEAKTALLKRPKGTDTT